jgi:hypothetical protein
MRVVFKPSALKESKWYEFVVRFAFGGMATALAGVIAKEYGPAVGGLFLAFPAIFPASATLVEKHERKRKEQHGLHGSKRGRKAAAIDAAGAALGSIGLIGFGGMVWWLAPRLSAWATLSLATLLWSCLSISGWVIRKKL